MMPVSLTTIASYLRSKDINFEVYGENIEVEKILAFSPLAQNALCYFAGSVLPDVSNIKNSIIICQSDVHLMLSESNSVILTKDPQLCLYLVSSLFEVKQKAVVHSEALVSPDSKIGSNVSIGPFCVLEGCVIGDNVTIEAGVKILKAAIVGNNVVIQSNTVIGATGVMWAWDHDNNKVMCVQTGSVIIRDGVFIGSNVTIVKGAFENKPTIIGSETMISHGTMIGHGVIVGDRCHFANNISIAGSVTIGNNCFLGSGVVVRPHITIPNDAIVGAGAVVVKDFLTEGIVLAGNPAREMNREKSVFSGVPKPYIERNEKE